MDSLAILERGHFYPSPSAGFGLQAECPYCVARHRPRVEVGETGLILGGWDAGQVVEFCSISDTGHVDGYREVQKAGTSIFNRDHVLILPHRLITIPPFLPKLSLRRCFVIDELAVWMCNEALCGLGFQWNDELVIEIARTCWEKRLPVTTSEVVRVLLAHGMPTELQKRFSDRFDYAIRILVAAHKRPAIKKFRTETSATDALLEFWRKAI